jgi:TPR repeat protein
MYGTGKGVPTDHGRAISLYRKACDGNDATGCTNLGAMYEDGLGITADLKQAHHYYAVGCNLGSSRGCGHRDRLQSELYLHDEEIAQTSSLCGQAVGHWKWSNGDVFEFTADGRWNILEQPVRGSWNCEINRLGEYDWTIKPDVGEWWRIVKIAPDGLSMLGMNRELEDVFAVRLSP